MARAEPQVATAESVMREAGLDANGFHSRSKITQVEVGKVQIDRSYQRDLSMNLVDEIADDWSEVASELVLISDRGNEAGLFVINGQHRSAAARKLGMKKIWARVVRLDDLDDPGLIEADLRLKTNRRLGDRPLERFKAQLRAGNEESLAIAAILAKYDTQINMIPSSDYGLNSVSTVEYLYRQDDGALLRETLVALQTAYGRIDSQTAGANRMKAVAWWIDKHGLEADVGRLVEKMTGIGLAALETRARLMQGTMGGSMWANVYRALIDVYNEGLQQKNKLEFSLRGIGKRGDSSDSGHTTPLTGPS